MGVNIVRASITGKVIYNEQSFNFANSAVVNTNVSATIPRPTTTCQVYQIMVYNPSTVTDLSIKIFNIDSLNGANRDCLLQTIIVPKSQVITGTTVSAYSFLIEGMFAGTDVKLVASNNTVLGASDTFSAYLDIVECS